jgi:hypothetical protein
MKVSDGPWTFLTILECSWQSLKVPDNSWRFLTVLEGSWRSLKVLDNPCHLIFQTQICGF